MKRVDAFTLTEVMIVVLIVSVLLGVAIPGYTVARRSARVNQARTELEFLAAAIYQMASDTGRWPGGVGRNSSVGYEVWDLSTADAGIMQADSDFPHWDGPYANTIPEDPWGSQYFFDQDYRLNGQWRVVVGSFGPNRSGRNVYDDDNVYIILD